MKSITKKLGISLMGIALLVLPIMALSQNIGTTISPLVREVSAKPGEKVTGKINLTNTGDGDQTYTPIVRNFTASDNPNSGAPQFLESADDQSLSRWTEFSVESLTLKPGAKGFFEYTINIPQDANPGGHYGAVIAQTKAKETEGTGVSVQPEVGSLVLVTVAGEQVVEAKVVDFRPVRNVFTMDLPSFVSSIRNSGNVHLKPVGSIDITGPANATINVNSAKASILPNSTRNFYSAAENDLPFGKYTAKLELRAEAPDGRTIPITAMTNFWVVPMSYILGFLAFLIVAYILMRHWIADTEKASGKTKTVTKTSSSRSKSSKSSSAKKSK